MKICTLIFTTVLLLCGIAQAGQLSVTGQHLSWNPPAEPSPTHVVGIENTAETSDPLFAWSLGLLIVPDPSAIGTLKFATATVPADYLLAGRSSGLVPAFSGPSHSIAPIGDTDALFAGVVVPATGKNLLATTFVASADARGVFQIAVVPDQFTGANWFSSDFQTARDFANVPFLGDPVVIGSVTVVPEPAASSLASLAIAAIGFFFGLRRMARCRATVLIVTGRLRTAQRWTC